MTSWIDRFLENQVETSRKTIKEHQRNNKEINENGWKGKRAERSVAGQKNITGLWAIKNTMFLASKDTPVQTDIDESLTH